MVNRANESRRLTYRVALPGGQERLRELVLYISQRASGMSRFGLIKLNKVIWRADFSAFAERGVPVTGRAYQRLKYGPAPIEMRPLLAEMEQSGQVEIDRIHLGHEADNEEIVELRPRALVEPSTHWFSQDDVSYVEQALQHYWHMTGMESSDESHGLAWKTRSNGDPMPYESALFSDEAVSEVQLNRVAGMAADRGWKSA